MILDIHTHRPTSAAAAQSILQASVLDFAPQPGQLYALGIHPWHIPSDPSSLLERLEAEAARGQVALIGETGIDALKGAPMFLQNRVFQAHIELSERLRKPLIVHCVKAFNEIVAFRKSSGASQPWIVHGFRGRPEVAEMLLRAGMALSFGEHFNAATVRSVPRERLFAETDESLLPIEEIIRRLSEARGEGDLTPQLHANLRSLGLREPPSTLPL